MQSCYSCILGQLYGFYFSGLEPLFGVIKIYERRTQEEKRHGFILYDEFNYETYDSQYRELGEAWKAEILRRLENNNG